MSEHVTHEQAIDELLAALNATAKKAASESVASRAANFAGAAANLAEAIAWLTSPSQPHGGSTRVEAGK